MIVFWFLLGVGAWLAEMLVFSTLRWRLGATEIPTRANKAALLLQLCCGVAVAFLLWRAADWRANGFAWGFAAGNLFGATLALLSYRR